MDLTVIGGQKNWHSDDPKIHVRSCSILGEQKAKRATLKWVRRSILLYLLRPHPHWHSAALGENTVLCASPSARASSSAFWFLRGLPQGRASVSPLRSVDGASTVWRSVSHWKHREMRVSCWRSSREWERMYSSKLLPQRGGRNWNTCPVFQLF